MDRCSHLITLQPMRPIRPRSGKYKLMYSSDVLFKRTKERLCDLMLSIIRSFAAAGLQLFSFETTTIAPGEEE
jgi:hypothetical protein